MAAARSFERKQLNVSSPQWNRIFCNACFLPSSRLQFTSILFSSLSKRCNSHIQINTRFYEYLMSIYFRSSMSNDITQAFWYHGAISRATAESLLELDGDFILRASCNNGQEQYVISCKSVMPTKGLHSNVQQLFFSKRTTCILCFFMTKISTWFSKTLKKVPRYKSSSPLTSTRDIRSRNCRWQFWKGLFRIYWINKIGHQLWHRT